MADITLHWSRKPYKYVDPASGEEIVRPNSVAWRQFEAIAGRENWENSLIHVIVMGFAQANDVGGRLTVPGLLIPSLENERSFKIESVAESSRSGRVGTIFGDVEVYVHPGDQRHIDIETRNGVTIKVKIQDF